MSFSEVILKRKHTWIVPIYCQHKYRYRFSDAVSAGEALWPSRSPDFIHVIYSKWLTSRWLKEYIISIPILN